MNLANHSSSEKYFVTVISTHLFAEKRHVFSFRLFREQIQQDGQAKSEAFLAP
jgi:hypothetical protein